MMVQCPSCGHSGKLPPSMESGQHKIRCRKCGVRFEAQPADSSRSDHITPMVDPEPPPDDGLDLGIELDRESEDEPAESLGTQDFWKRASSRDLESEEKAVEPSAVEAGGLNLDRSDDELPVQPHPIDAHAQEPWFYGFLDAWGTFYLYLGAFAFLVTLLALVGVLAGLSSDTPGFPIGTAIVGILGVGLLGTFLITCAAFILLIVDQARNIRCLRVRAETNGQQ
jgi:hypothetical protein